jgi:quercetin dioxygenase-like cupin family protein
MDCGRSVIYRPAPLVYKVPSTGGAIHLEKSGVIDLEKNCRHSWVFHRLLQRMKTAGRRDIKRAIFGVGDRGLNVTLHEGPLRPLGSVHIAWASKSVEPSTDDYAANLPDFNLRLAPGETRFVRVEIAPGAESSLHRTPRINDYLIALSGELTMRLEDGSSCRIEAGDMFVQLAGWHSWKNEGSEPFVMAGVVIGIRTDENVPYGVEKSEAGA